MGDERSCPGCGDRLAFDAKVCSCGWAAKGRRGESAPRHDSKCSWRSGDLECQWPVGFFEPGQIRGFCLFHRHEPSGIEAARCAKESLGASPVDYLDRAKATLYGNESPAVKALRSRLSIKPGNLGQFMRQPGDDEGVA